MISDFSIDWYVRVLCSQLVTYILRLKRSVQVAYSICRHTAAANPLTCRRIDICRPCANWLFFKRSGFLYIHILIAGSNQLCRLNHGAECSISVVKSRPLSTALASSTAGYSATACSPSYMKLLDLKSLLNSIGYDGILSSLVVAGINNASATMGKPFRSKEGLVWNRGRQGIVWVRPEGIRRTSFLRRKFGHSGRHT